MGACAPAPQSKGRNDVEADPENSRRVSPQAQDPASLAKCALRRQTPEVGAECPNGARSDLCGGRSAIGVPTAHKVFADWEAHRLLPSGQTRQRSGKLSRAEMLFIVVLFHLSPYKNFKVFYLYGIGGQYRACFDELPHYDRLVSLMPRLFVPLMVLLHGLSGEQ